MASHLLLRCPEGSMEMFLMALCLSLLGVVTTAVVFVATTRAGREAGEAAHPGQGVSPSAPPRFFVRDMEVRATAPRVPVEALLLQVERHIQLEQAAAQSFLDCPTVESLHSRTNSPLVH